MVKRKGTRFWEMENDIYLARVNATEPKEVLNCLGHKDLDPVSDILWRV